MKLSEVPGERTMDVLAAIVEPVSAIATDEKLRHEIADAGGDKTKLAAAIAPWLLKEHGSDVMAVLAAIEGQSVEQYEATHRLPQVMAGIMDVITDPDLLSFLPSAAETGSGASA